MKVLVEYGAFVDSITQKGVTPLYLAVKKGQTEMAKVRLQDYRGRCSNV